MTFKAGLVQMRSGRDMQRNLRDASDLIRMVVAKGARYVQTPEVTNVFELDKDYLKKIALTEQDDPVATGLSDLAAELGIFLHVGSLALKGESGKLVNRALLFGPDGRKIVHYDKVHLFDIDLANGDSYRESATYDPGASATVAELPFCKMGFAICYDVRFPKLFNALANAGANVIAIPAAFTVPTGEAHWHVLQRARAIETGSYVLSAAQGGMHEAGKATYGHSLAISPWGEILAEGGTEPDGFVVDIDPAQSADARARIPALKNARAFSLKTVSAVAG
jgi:deaminated glutathione amidase